MRQCSYFCELITAAALAKQGVTDTWQSSLSQIFTFLTDHTFSQPIIFSDYYDAQSVTYLNDLVIVLDVVNSRNNVAKRWNQDIKRDYLNKLRETRDLIKKAQAHERAGQEDEAVDMWCQVFGDDFRRLSQ